MTQSGGRSKFIEEALRDYIQRTTRNVRDRRDRDIIDRYAASLNREALDALSHQTDGLS